MNLDSKEKELLKQQESAKEELKLVEFLKTFDDKILYQKRSRYSELIWISERVNQEAQEINYYYGCGCCPDSDYHARPEMTLDFNGKPIKIYGISVYLGDKDYDSRLCWFIDDYKLTSEMKKLKYNDFLIQKVLEKRIRHLDSLEKISEAKEEADYE